MYRGTTPTLTFHINSDLNLLTIDELWITFKSNAKEKTFTLADVSIDNDNKQIMLEMEQEDTLYFGSGKLSVQIRIRTSDDNAYASNIKQINLDHILKDGVI